MSTEWYSFDVPSSARGKIPIVGSGTHFDSKHRSACGKTGACRQSNLVLFASGESFSGYPLNSNLNRLVFGLPHKEREHIMRSVIRQAWMRGAVPLAVGAAIIAVPSASLALAAASFAPAERTESSLPFTPASVDPILAERVANRYAAARKAIRFTPAGRVQSSDRTVTVAVRVDERDARAISVRSALASAQSQPGRRTIHTIAPTRFDLGVSRGYQSFAQPAAQLPAGVVRVDMPDLAEFKPKESTTSGKPSRFTPRLSLDKSEPAGRAPRTLESQGEQSVDLGGSFRVSRNLDLTAGVRLSQERDRLAPLTDGTEDDQSVYVGTQLRF